MTCVVFDRLYWTFVLWLMTSNDLLGHRQSTLRLPVRPLWSFLSVFNNGHSSYIYLLQIHAWKKYIITGTNYRALTERKPLPRLKSHEGSFFLSGRKHVGHRCWQPLPQTNITRRGTYRLLVWPWNENGAIEQNTYDFLLVFYSNYDRISYRFCATVDFMPK